jgi:predicted Zn-dependent peptidase
LRVNSGLTYGASSSFDERRVAGPFAISSFTRNATTAEAIDLALEVLGRLHEQGLSEEQLGSAKGYLKGQFPTQVETPRQLAELLAELEYYGLDEREVNDYFARLDAVTAAEARRIIREHFPRENLVFVLIGKAAEIRPAAAKYASQVEAREIVRPGFD